MLSQRINAWLQSPDDYQVGLSLLRETGYADGPTGRFTLTILSKGADAYNQNRLEVELRNWLVTQKDVLPIKLISPAIAEVNSEPKPNTPKIVSTAAPAQEPAGVHELRSRTYQLMDERAELKARLRAKMDDADAQEQRRDWAFRIKAITRELDEVFSQLDFFNEHGYLPHVAHDPAVAIDDTAALLNIRSYVSRYRAKLKKTNLTPEQRQSARQLLEQYEAEKNRLELKLNKHHDSHSTGQQTTDCPTDYPALSGA